MTTWTIGTSKTASTWTAPSKTSSAWSIENKYSTSIPWADMTMQWSNATGSWDSYVAITAPTWTQLSKS